MSRSILGLSSFVLAALLMVGCADTSVQETGAELGNGVVENGQEPACSFCESKSDSAEAACSKSACTASESCDSKKECGTACDLSNGECSNCDKAPVEDAAVEGLSPEGEEI